MIETRMKMKETRRVLRSEAVIRFYRLYHLETSGPKKKTRSNILLHV